MLSLPITLANHTLLNSASQLNDPPTVAARYDASDHASTTSDFIRIDGSNRVSLVADKSGNSAVNVLANNTGGAAQTVWVDPATTVGTGQFTVTFRVFFPAVNPATNNSLGFQLGPNVTGTQGADSCYLALESTGTLRLVKRSAADVLQTVLTVASFATTYGGALRTIGVRRNASRWDLFVDGVSVANSVSFFAESVSSTNFQLCPRDTQTADSVIRWHRFYNTGLSDADMLAEATGSPASGVVVNVDWSLAPKLATSFVCATGQTVTVTSSGDLGARISGERDLVQLTVSKQPTYDAATRSILFDGSNDYLKSAAFALSQPESVYFVGQQVSWTGNDGIIDGNASSSMQLYQNSASPRVDAFAGSNLSGATLGWAIGESAIISAVFNAASSSLRKNRNTALTGNTGSSAGNGFTVGAGGAGLGGANIRFNEAILRSAADATAVQGTITDLLAARWGVLRPNPVVTLSTSSLSSSLANGAAASASVTSTVTLGLSPFTYSWARISGDAAITATTATASSTTFSSTGTDEQFNAVFRLTVTDSYGNTGTADINVTNTHGTPP